MTEYRVEPIDTALAQGVRETLKDPIYGLPVHVEPATGYGPCRVCLRTFAPDEPRILFLYNPFSPHQDADFAGPIFIHAETCAPYPDPAVFPGQVAGLPIVLKGYDADQRCVAQSVPASGGVASALRALLERSEVEYVHVRNNEAKCYIARVVRQ
jgi:uncharacterized protein DUF1203